MEKGFVTFDREALKITVHLGDDAEADGELVIKKDDVQITYFSGGPGGQNVNRSLKGVQLIYQIPEAHIRAAVRTRQLLTRTMETKSLHQNLETAFAQLAQKLQNYFYVPPVRKATKTPRRAKEKRLKGKKIQSLKKDSRKKIDF